MATNVNVLRLGDSEDEVIITDGKIRRYSIDLEVSFELHREGDSYSVYAVLWKPFCSLRRFFGVADKNKSIEYVEMAYLQWLDLGKAMFEEYAVEQWEIRYRKGKR